jgi:hypothetical protein
LAIWLEEEKPKEIKMDRATFPIEFNNEIDDVKKSENEFYTLAVDRLSNLAEGHNDISGAMVNFKLPAKERQTAYIYESRLFFIWVQITSQLPKKVSISNPPWMALWMLLNTRYAVNARFVNIANNSETTKWRVRADTHHCADHLHVFQLLDDGIHIGFLYDRQGLTIPAMMPGTLSGASPK